jgi:hypothetical protein
MRARLARNDLDRHLSAKWRGVSRAIRFLLRTLRMASETLEVDGRAFRIFRGVIRYVRTVRPEPGIWKIADQMVAASGSVCANRQEATSASSRKEFIRFNEIALRSAKESRLAGCLRGYGKSATGSHASHSLQKPANCP